MNVEELIFDSGRNTAFNAVEIAIKNPQLIPQFIEIAFKNKKQFSMRAANVIEKLDYIKPNLLSNYIDKIISFIPSCENEGVKRSFLKMISRYTKKINEENLNILLNNCFKWLVSSNTEIAVKYYCMIILYDISNIYPEIKNELYHSIQVQLPNSSAGIKNIGHKLLKKLNKDIL